MWSKLGEHIVFFIIAMAGAVLIGSMVVGLMQMNKITDGDTVCIVREAQESYCGVIIKEGY